MMALLFGFISLTAWGYTFIGAAGAYGLGMRLSDMPQWWYTAAAAAVLTLVICIAGCVHDIRKVPERDPRRLGVIRYDSQTGEWYCDPGEDKR